MTELRKKTPVSGERKQEVRSVRNRLKDYGLFFASIASGVNALRPRVHSTTLVCHVCGKRYRVQYLDPESPAAYECLECYKKDLEHDDSVNSDETE